MFLHIPKTGGSTVTEHLRRQARGGQGWAHTTITTDRTWPDVLARMRRQTSRPKLIVVHHVEASGALADPALQAAVIAPLRCLLRERACHLVLTTLLRDASARASSAAFYHRVPHAEYSGWIGEHATDGAVSFILHNRVRLRRRNQTIQMTRTDLQRATMALANFDSVGRTEELDAFLAHLDALLGWKSPHPHPRDGGPAHGAAASTPPKVNTTPERQKYALTSAERAWTANRTTLDAQLVASLCEPLQPPPATLPSGACPLRRAAMLAASRENSTAARDRCHVREVS